MTPPERSGDDWNRWSVYVLRELERLNTEIQWNRRLLMSACAGVGGLLAKMAWDLVRGGLVQ